MRLLTKAEACREMSLSLSTLNRRITAGDIPVRREPRGKRHRVYVMLGDDPPENGELAEPELVAARERVRGLEDQVTLLQEQLEQESRRNAGLVNQLKAAQEKRDHWWRFWVR